MAKELNVYSVKSKKDDRTYYLHGKQAILKGNKPSQIYWFALDVTKTHALTTIPSGYKIIHNKRTGLPMLKKIKIDSTDSKC